MRRSLSLLSLLCACLPLTACYQWEGYTPGGSLVPVYFPDDHRVLHGTWQLQLNPPSGPQRHAMSADGQAILLWAHGRNPLHLADGDGVFRPHQPAIDFGDLLDGHFDRGSGSLVRFGYDYGDEIVTVEQRSMLGGPLSRMQFSLPAGTRAWEDHVMQGGWFLLTEERRDDDQQRLRLDIFDPADGSHLGSLPLPDLGGQLQSNSDRVLGFVDTRNDLIHVVDTRRPDHLLTVARRACESGSFVDLSQSGRWLMLSGCRGTSYLVDLEQPEPTFAALPWPEEERPSPAFAQGDDQIVWYDEDGHIGRFDLADGLHHDIPLGDGLPRFSEDPSRAPPAWYPDLGLLVYQEAGNRLVVASVEGDQISAAQTLPSVWLEQAELSLEAHELRADGLGYRVRGQLHLDGQSFDLDGTVVSQGLHYYRPSPYAGAASAERRLSFRASMTDASGLPAYDLVATNPSNYYAVWDAVLGAASGDQATMTLSRP